jgi:hypothetical protein
MVTLVFARMTAMTILYHVKSSKNVVGIIVFIFLACYLWLKIQCSYIDVKDMAMEIKTNGRRVS